MATQGDSEQPGTKSYDRNLGVIEALIAVRDQCPMGSVRKVAMLALEAAKEPKKECAGNVLREQAYFVLTAIQGWRGERSRQVHRSLQAFLDASNPN